jgi:hypothetical protein
MIVFPFSFIRTTNLLLEYNTFSILSYNGSGTTIYDISGNSRNGTITGSPTWTSDYFTFSDDYVTTPNLSSAIPISNEVHSVEVWVYPTNNGVLVQYNGTPTPNTSYHFSAIEIVSGNLEVGLWTGVGGLVSTGNIGAVSFDQWHQIVLTYNGSVCKGYLDGVFKGSVNTSFQSPMDDSLSFYMNFGYRDTTNQGDGTDFNGRFGIMRVYNTALTDAQVLSNYNSTVIPEPFINPTLTIGSAVTTNTQSPFAGGGNSYVFSSNVNSYITTPGSDDWAVGTGDFTVEWFSYQTTLTQFQRAFTVGNYPSIKIGVSIESGIFYYWANNSFRYSLAAASTANQWIHWAVVRQSGVTKVYKNGTLLGSQISDSNNITDNTTTFVVGNTNTFATNAALVGYLTNFRFVKGLAVYTGNFTKPTSALTATAGANPYGGSNTQAIGAGFTKLLLVP